MKRCSTCNRTYTDQNLSFCIDDGTPLTTVTAEDETTVVSPQARDTSSGSEWNPAPYKPPGTYVPSNTGAKRRRVWPWVLGIGGAFLLGIVAISVVAALLAPKLFKRPETVITVRDADRNQSANANTSQPANTNTNQSANTNSDRDVDVDTPPPTDHDQVLAQLIELENEWTDANSKADKRALNRILADDYVGPDESGYPKSKAEYLRNIQPANVEQWKFHDLELELTGERARLTGRATFVSDGSESELLFIDKFVWREGRWQATASQIAPVQ